MSFLTTPWSGISENPIVEFCKKWSLEHFAHVFTLETTFQHFGSSTQIKSTYLLVYYHDSHCNPRGAPYMCNKLYQENMGGVSVISHRTPYVVRNNPANTTR